MDGSTAWVQDKISLYEGELLIFKRPNSPNYYYRVWVSAEGKYRQNSLKTSSKFVAIEQGKKKYQELATKMAKGEKIFTITFEEALKEYEKILIFKQQKDGLTIEWVKRKLGYLRNHFIHHIGSNAQVNTITDKQIQEYFGIRLSKVGRRQTVKQEIIIVTAFYKECIVKNGYAFSCPEMPKIKITKEQTSKRKDTFTSKEIEKLFKFMLNDWCISPDSALFKTKEKIRIPVNSKYGSTGNRIQNLNSWRWEMEIHRRHMMMYACFLLASTGMRTPHEIFNLTWGDIEFKSVVLEKNVDRNDLMTSVDILGIEDLLHQEFDKAKHKPNAISKIAQDWMENDRQRQIQTTLHIRGKTGYRAIPFYLNGLFKQIEAYYQSIGIETPLTAEQPIFMECYGCRKGKAFDVFAFTRLFRELMRDAGLTRIHFTSYHFRHYYITNRILNGVDVDRIAEVCGNSSEMIRKTYSHVILENVMTDIHKKR